MGTHGGRREGAGRKPKRKTVQTTVRIEEKLLEALKNEAAKGGRNQTQILEDALVKELGFVFAQRDSD